MTSFVPLRLLGRQRRLRRAAAASIVLAVIVGVIWLRKAPGQSGRQAPSRASVDVLARLPVRLLSSLGTDRSWRGVAASNSAASQLLLPCGTTAADLAKDAADVAAAASAASEPEAAASDASTLIPVFLLPPLTPSEQRIVAALQQSPDAFSRAAALVLAPSGEPDDPSARLEQLATMALRSNDARLYALAYRSCIGRTDDLKAPTCGLLTPAQWARIDSDNGMPWSYVLSSATRRHDAAGVDDALFHLGTAQRIDDRFFDVAAVMVGEAAAGDDAATLAGWSLIGRSISSGSMPPFSSLIEQCRGLALTDANRRQLCAVVGDRMIEHGTSMLLQAIGGSVDRLVTGSAVRADRLRAEREAYFRSLQANDFTCSGMRFSLRREQRAAEIGEVAAWREALTPPLSTTR